MRLTVIDKVEGVEQLSAYLADKDLFSYDLESTGVHKGAEIIGISVCADEAEAFYVIIAAWDKDQGKLTYLPGMKEATAALIRTFVGKQLIMHNGVFDCSMTEAFFKISLIDSLHTDTMVLAHLLDENRLIGLKELGKDLLGESATKEQSEMKASITANGGSATKKKYELYKADRHLIAKYGAKDAWLTLKLFFTMVPQLFDEGLDAFFYEHETMPLLKGPTYELNTAGLRVDGDALLRLKKQLQADCLEAKAFIEAEIAALIKAKYPATSKKTTFNIGSSSQLAWLLFGVLELEFNTLTKGGKTICKALDMKTPYTFPAKRAFIAQCLASKDRVYVPEVTLANGKIRKAQKIRDPWSYIQCDNTTLKKLAPKFKWIQRLIEFQSNKKLLSTYVGGIEERMQYGVIHPNFKQAGTDSGRYSCSNPNFQNLPRDDKRIKECIVARPGKVFVGADYSQLEPRVFAYYSKDERLLASFDGTSDFYSVIGREVFGKLDSTPQKEGSPDAFGVKYKKLRDISKVIALSATYGTTAFQLAKKTGKTADATQEDMDEYFERFPGVAKMMEDAHDTVRKQGFVTSLFGRIRRVPEAVHIPLHLKHSQIKDYNIRSPLNLAVNFPIQSTGASIVNRAAIKFHQSKASAGIAAKLVLQVHDSLVVECDEADGDNILILLQDAMENTTTLEGVHLEAVPKIGKNLGEV